jgi:phosphoribosylglycinamide formyltransferase-1
VTLKSAAARKPVIVVISGRGSNMQALIEAGRALDSSFDVVRVVSDKPDAGGLQIARSMGVDVRTVPAAANIDRASYDAQLAAAIEDASPALIALAGFMRILSPGFVQSFEGRLLNIHPSLLPKYTGLHTHRRALAAGDAEHGATVHFVTDELDGGPPVLQARVPVLPGDDESSLSARVHRVEHKIFPAVVNWYCAGRLSYRDAHAWFDGGLLEAPLQWGAERSNEA